MPNTQPLRVSDGITTFEGGVDGGKNPSLIGKNQVSWAENCTFRGAEVRQRPGFREMAATMPSGMNRLSFQGVSFYEDNAGRGFFIAAAGGRMFRGRVTNNTIAWDEISVSGSPNNDQAPIVFMTQADRYLVAQDGVNLPFIYDGATSRRADLDEVPIGSGPMAYGMGRLWVARGSEYVAGDILGGPTGVLKFTENDYLNEGGSFTVPLRSGLITTMQFTASPNTALGQGELLVATPDSVFSTVVPVARDVWKDVTDPLQRIVVINNGSLAQDSATLVNGDVFMRSRDGIRSVIQAVRNFEQLGNVPISREVNRALAADDPTLLRFSSSILFDNRLLMTTSAVGKFNGAYFKALACLDFDLISSMGQRSPPAWDGVWTGLQFLKLIKGRFNGVERAFAIVRNPNKGFLKDVIVRTGFALPPGGASTSISGGGGSGAAISTLYELGNFSVINGGTGYAVGNIITIPGGAGTATCRFLVTAVSSGVVTAISVISSGLYSTPPTVIPFTSNYATSGGSGTGLVVFATVYANRFTVTNQGSGYTSPPTITASGFAGVISTFQAYAIMDYEWEVWEITKDLKFDSRLVSGVRTDQRIESHIETSSYSFNSKFVRSRDIKKLHSAELWMDHLVGQVDATIEYKADQYQCWHPWHTWQMNTVYKDCATSTNCQPKTYIEQSRSRIGIPAPPSYCEPHRAKPSIFGREFQIRLSWTGHAGIQLIELIATTETEETNPPCAPAVEAAVALECPCNT